MSPIHKHKAGNTGSLSRLLALLGASTAALLGASVLVAWHLRLEHWLRVRPGFAPMGYNTALCLLLCGLGLTSATLRWRRPAALAATAVATIGSLKLVEYAVGVELGLDRLVFDARSASPNLRLVTMAPNAAICLVLSAGALLEAHVDAHRARRSLSIGLLGSVIAAIGTVALFGYLVGMEHAYGWSHLQPMSFLAALGFVGLGLGTVALAWHDSEHERRLGPPWLPLLIGIGVGTATLGVWQGLWVDERSHVEETVRLQEITVRNELAARLESRLLAMVRMARRWELRERTDREFWNADASLLVRDYPGLQSITWVDTSLRTQWIVPVQGNEALLWSDLISDPRWQRTLRAASETGGVAVSPPVDLIQGGKGFLVCVALLTEGKAAGFIVGTFRGWETFESLLTDVARGYCLSVLDGGEEVYRRGSAELPEPWAKGRGVDFALANASWRVRVAPEPATLDEMEAAEDELTLGAGLLLAALLGVAVHLAQIAARKARHAEEANRDLRAGILERSRAEEAVRRSEGLLKAVLDQLPVGVWILDPTGGITLGNPAGRELWGGARYVGPDGYGAYKGWWPSGRRIGPEEWGAARAIHRGETSLNEEIEIESFDGARKTIVHSAAPIRGSEGEILGAVVVNYDLTDRKHMEEELRRTGTALQEAEAKYRALVEQVPVVTYAAAPDEVGKFLFVSPQIETYLGFAREQWLSAPSLWLRQMHPEDRERMEGEARRERSLGERLRWEYRLVGKDGRTLWFRDEGEVVRAPSGGPLYRQGVLIDVTERKTAEQALRESEQKLRDFFEEDISAAVISNPRGEVLYCNSAYVRMFGFASMEEALQTPATRSYRPGSREQMLAILRKHGKLLHYEVEFLRRDRTSFPAIANIVGKFDASGELVQLQSYFFDDTEHRKAEEQLRQSQKLESVGTLVAGIAHDFNNILMGIMGRADLSLLALPAESPVRRDQELILQFCDRAANLIAQLMAFSRPDSSERRHLDVTSVAKETTKILQRTLPETISIELEVAKDLRGVYADPTQLQQVLMNLCVNARDAMPEGGDLKIALRNVSLDEAYCRQAPEARPGRYVCASVRDTGLGMTPEVRERAFEPFFTTKRPGSGTGLGLAMVYGIVKSHQGFVRVYSEAGSGTEFQIYLPAHGPAAADPAEPEPEIRGGSETVLLVEDDPGVREVAGLLLRNLGYRVLTAVDGEEALRQLGTDHGVQAVLCDCVMPKMGGLALAQALSERSAAPPVLLMSGYASVTDRESMSALGVSAFVQKPLGLRDLAASLRSVLD